MACRARVAWASGCVRCKELDKGVGVSKTFQAVPDRSSCRASLLESEAQTQTARQQQRRHACHDVSCSRHKPTRASPCGCEQMSQRLLSTSQRVACDPQQTQHTDSSSPKAGCLSVSGFPIRRWGELEGMFPSGHCVAAAPQSFVKFQQRGQLLFMKLPAPFLVPLGA